MAEHENRILNRDIYERIVKLETQMLEVCKQMEKIKTNDLVHLQRGMDRIEDKIHELDKTVSMNAVKIAGFMSVAVVILNFVINHLLGNIL